MNILVINCGSSSLKYQLIDSESEQVLAKGICERIKLDGVLTHQAAGKEKIKIEAPMPDHSAAVKIVLDKLTDPELGAISSLDEIHAIGHRVVHGGEKFASSALINEDVLAAIEECNDLAPLHNPANLIGIKACETLMPGVPQVAVFDTAFHQTMPECAYIYGIPYEYYEKYKVRRYGFHGTSHSFVSKRTAELLGRDISDTKIIVCHLGGGASICAVQGGKSIDTTMGLTPLEGITMGTRSGNIDPAIIEFIAGKEGKSIAEIMNILNKESGVLGISGVSSDFRDINKGMAENNKRCDIAMNVFCYQAAKFIGGYVAAMNGVDAVVFTAGVGENDPLVRKLTCDRLQYLGVEIDDEANKLRGEEVRISTDNSRVPVYVVPTNEELAIARETVALI
ncbi:MAG: acetate kinase [Wujia sp.]